MDTTMNGNKAARDILRNGLATVKTKQANERFKEVSRAIAELNKAKEELAVESSSWPDENALKNEVYGAMRAMDLFAERAASELNPLKERKDLAVRAKQEYELLNDKLYSPAPKKASTAEILLVSIIFFCLETTGAAVFFNESGTFANLGEAALTAGMITLTLMLLATVVGTLCSRLVNSHPVLEAERIEV